MLKILICDPNYTEGVNRVSTILKIKYWQKQGEKITIFCTNEAKRFYQKNLKNIDYLTFPYKYHIRSYWDVPLEYLKANFTALCLLKKVKNRFDIVYSLSSTIDFLFLPWLLRFFDRRIRWLVVVDNIVPKPSQRPGNYILKLIPYLAFRLGNQLLKKADGIFVVTDFLKNYYEQRGVKVIKTSSGYGVEIEIFKGKIPPNTPKFDALYCGRFHIAKGIFDLLEVVKMAVKKDKNFTLGVMGDGDKTTKKRFRDKIREYKLEKNIILLGYKTGKEKGDIFRNCGFFLFLSYDEGCPQVVIEALAANRLIVAYKLPIYHEVFVKYIKRGQLVLFKKGDVENVARHISKRDYNKLKFYSKLEDYGWDKIAKKELESFYGHI